MTQTPPKFNVGDRVTFTNDYGVVWPNKIVTEVKTFPEGGIFSGQTRYHLSPTDTPWFPTAERNLSHMIFVFGSNTAGRHGKGAALAARTLHGAVYGVAEGLTGNAYALPTCGRRFEPLSLETIQQNVTRFIEFARNRQDLGFQVTRVGCGLAYCHDKDIAPMFKDAPAFNVFFDEKWKPFLGEGYDYWGTF